MYCEMKRLSIYPPLLILLLVAVISLHSYIPKTHASNHQAPVGQSMVKNGILSGWSYDADTPNSPVTIHVYIDEPAGAAPLATQIVSNQANADANQVLNISGNYGFSWTIPNQYRDSKTHSMYIYALDTSSVATNNILLHGSPKYFMYNASEEYKLLVDAGSGSARYAYAPSIIYENGVYHLFYCSPGPPGWDKIRYIKSTDYGVTWSLPVVKLETTGSNNAIAACDPSIVFFQGYYYMYFSSAYEIGKSPTGEAVFQTIIQIARSATIDGEYRTYTTDGMWVKKPSNPKTLIFPQRKISPSENPVGYGAGQQSVVVKDGKIHMWYTDDSPQGDIYVWNQWKNESTDPVNWDFTKSVKTSMEMHSPDIRYDPNTKKFIAVVLVEGHVGQNDTLAVNYSNDGLTWGNFIELVPRNEFPDHAHNIGVSVDVTGSILDGQNLVAWGGPRDFKLVDGTNVWGSWNLWGRFIDLSSHATQPSACVAQGMKVDKDGNKCTGVNCPSNANVRLNSGETINVNPYSFQASGGTNKIVAEIPSGFNVSISKCDNCIDHPLNSYVPGNELTFNCPANGYTDVYIKYSSRNSTCAKKRSGDASCDDKIDLVDFNEFLGEFSSLQRTGSLPNNEAVIDADFNNNTTADLGDFNIWLLSYVQEQRN